MINQHEHGQIQSFQNELTKEKTKFLIQRLRHEHTEHTNKSGKYLANFIKRNKILPVFQKYIRKSCNVTDTIILTLTKVCKCPAVFPLTSFTTPDRCLGVKHNLLA